MTDFVKCANCGWKAAKGLFMQPSNCPPGERTIRRKHDWRNEDGEAAEIVSTEVGEVFVSGVGGASLVLDMAVKDEDSK